MPTGTLSIEHGPPAAERYGAVAVEPVRIDGAREGPGLSRRAWWLLALRPLVATLVIGSSLLVDASDPRQIPRDFGWYLIGMTWLLSAAYIATRGVVGRWPWVIEAQLVVDAWSISILVLLTGGFNSDFVALYILPILAGSVLRFKRGGLIVAGYSAGLFAMIVASQYGIVIPRPDSWGLIPASSAAAAALPSPRYAFYFVGLHCTAFLAVARLTGYLAENLRRSDASLKLASTAIADLQVYTQHVINSMTGGLAATDAHGRLVMFNRAAEIITGLHAAEVLGRDAADILRLPRALRAALVDMVESGRGRRTVYLFARGDGRELEIGMSVGPLVTSSGRGYLFTFQDVTESRRAEREAELQKRLAAIGNMAAGIAHEIRNPLASMSGSMQVLRQELQLAPEQSQLFDIVLRESERLNATIRDFLNYARPQQGQASSMDMAVVLRDTARLLDNSPDCTTAHRVVVEAPPELAAFAVEPQVRQVVWNLATNALRAMPRGGVLRLSVKRTRGDDDSGVVTLAVSDEGIGIAAEDIERIFQPFHGGFAKGAGLGLAIVHRIVTEHGGTIHVSSEVGAGTTIEIRLPERSAAEIAA